MGCLSSKTGDKKEVDGDDGSEGEEKETKSNGAAKGENKPIRGTPVDMNNLKAFEPIFDPIEDYYDLGEEIGK